MNIYENVDVNQVSEESKFIVHLLKEKINELSIKFEDLINGNDANIENLEVLESRTLKNRMITGGSLEDTSSYERRDTVLLSSSEFGWSLVVNTVCSLLVSKTFKDQLNVIVSQSDMYAAYPAGGKTQVARNRTVVTWWESLFAGPENRLTFGLSIRSSIK